MVFIQYQHYIQVNVEVFHMMLEKLLLFQVWLHLVQAIIDYLQILVIMNQNQNLCLEVDKFYIH